MSILIGLILTFGLSYLMYIQRQREGQHSLILPALNLIFPLIGLIWGIKNKISLTAGVFMPTI